MEYLCVATGSIAAVFGTGSFLMPRRSGLSLIGGSLLACTALTLYLSAAHYRTDPWLRLPPTTPLSILALGAILVFHLSFHLAKLETERRRFGRYPILALLPAAAADLLQRIGGAPAPEAVLRTTACVSIALLCALALLHIFRHHFPDDMSRLAWTVLSASGLGFIALVIGLAALIRGNARLYGVFDAVLSILILGGAALSFRHRDSVERFREETVRLRYARSSLAGLDVEALISGMDEMVRRTALYRSPSCSLEELAKRMGLSRHQTSELLNERMGTNFTAFINAFRVEAAKELLLARPDMTVLSVALEVGFGNKTTFNEAFRKREDRTPKEYRRSR